ncbi:hypothetical protein WN943_024200 [Citrus x changshan-huyou]
MAVASLQIGKPSLLSSVSISQSNFPGKLDSGKVFLSSWYGSIPIPHIKYFPGEEPPESLFMKELKRRGMTPTSLLEDSSRTDSGLDDKTKLKEEDIGFSRRNTVSTEIDKSLADQRERSMALNSEGLEGRLTIPLIKKHSRELMLAFLHMRSSHLVKLLAIYPIMLGLVPRAKLLLTLGGTFFLGFWPLILVTVGFFSALYFYFGPTFVHDASNSPMSPAQYGDPYALLEDERISQIAPHVN